MASMKLTSFGHQSPTLGAIAADLDFAILSECTVVIYFWVHGFGDLTKHEFYSAR